MSIKYKGPDMDAALKALDKLKKDKGSSKGSTGDGVRWFSLPEDGKVKIRFLPALKGSGLPGKLVYKHYNMPPHEKMQSNITCLKTWGLDCPICNVVEKYKEMEGIELKDYQAVGRAHFNILVLAEDYDRSIPYVLSAGAYNYEWLLTQFVNEDVGDITDPFTGANVTFSRKKPKGAFDRIVSRKSTPIAGSDEDIEAILDQCYDLDKIWRQADDEYVKIATEIAESLDEVIDEKYSGLKEGINKSGKKSVAVKEVVNAKKKLKQQEEDEEEVTPTPVIKSKKNTVVEDTEDDEEDTPPPVKKKKAPVVEDDEDDTPVVRVTKKGKKAPVEESEEEEVVDPDDEDTPPPVKKKKAPVVEDDEEDTPPPSAVKKPKNLDCFGEKYNEKDRKCIVCLHDVQCMDASKKK